MIISNNVFSITGEFTNISRKDLRDFILAKGGKIANTLNENVNYLIAGNNSGSKILKATSLGISVLTINEII